MRLPLRSVAFERHLYTVRDERGNASPELERHLQREVEEPFLRWHRGVMSARRGQAPAIVDRMTRGEFAIVARYILYQHLRTHAQRLSADRLAALSTQLYWTDPETIAQCRAMYQELAPNARKPLTRKERQIDFDAWMSVIRTLSQRRSDWHPPLAHRPAAPGHPRLNKEESPSAQSPQPPPPARALPAGVLWCPATCVEPPR